MTNLPTIKQLRYFIALEKYGHFGRAAEACFVSQPAFSVAIRELESVLDLQLVDRTNKQVIMTSIGKDIAAQARLVLRDLEGLVEMASMSHAPLAAELKLGIIPTIAPFLLPGLLPGLRKAFPDLKLILHEDQTQRVYDQLMEGDLDVILVALPFELKNTEHMKLFDDPFCLAYHRNSKFIDSDDINIEGLPDHSILLMEDGHCLRDHALTACKVRNVNKVSRVTANSLLTLVQMVDSDLGITYLPQMAVDSGLLKNTRVDTRPLKKASRREIGLVWRRGSVRGREFELLGEHILRFRQKQHG